MTEDQLASLRRIGASLTHAGAACAESCKHAGAGSVAPLQPLDTCLAVEVRNLEREGQDALAAALVALRGEMGEPTNG